MYSPNIYFIIGQFNKKREENGAGRSCVSTFHHCAAAMVPNAFGDEDGFVKSIEPDTLSKTPFAEAESLAHYLGDAIRAYYRALSDRGVPVPPEHHLVTDINSSAQTAQVFEVSTYCGADVAELLANEPKRSDEFIAQILCMIDQALGDETVGLDPHPANIALRAKTGKLTYIDFFPARCLYNGQCLIGFPQPTNPNTIQRFLKRYYTVFGVLRLLRFNLKRISGELVDVFFRQVARSSPIIVEASQGFDELPDRQVQQLLQRREVSSVEKVIEGLHMHDIETAREVAAEIVSNRQTLSELFTLTHQDFRLPIEIRNQRFEQFKQQLLSYKW